MSRLLVVDTWREWGGGERYVLELVRRRDDRVQDIAVVAADGRLRAEVARLGARPLRLPLVRRHTSSWQLLLSLALLPVLWLQWLLLAILVRPDEVHIVTLEDQLVATPVFRALGIPVTWSVHGRLDVRRDPLHTWLLRTMARSARGIIAVSTEAREALAAHGIPAARIRLIHNGVASAPAMPRQDRPLTVGFVGRLTDVKDPMLFLSAAQGLHAVLPDARFVVYGEGDLASACRELVESLGLTAVVDLRGFDADLDAIYAAFDVLVVTSRTEGLPMAPLEAGARGIPTVAVDLPASREVIEDRATGLVVERTAEALRDALARLAADRAELHRLGDGARAHVGARFGVERMIDETYEVLLGKTAIA